MSEKYIPRPENHEHAHEADEVLSHEHHERIAKHTAEQAERAKREKSAENLAKIREMAKTEAESASKLKAEKVPEDETGSVVGMQHSLKAQAYERTLAKIRSHLSAPARSFSRLVHNPLVEKVSGAGAQTVGRPSGLLGGSIVAFFGSVVTLYYSKHYGFRYNYLVLFVLFVGGFAAGASIELLVWLAYGRKRRY